MLAQYHRKKELVAKFDRVYYFIHTKKSIIFKILQFDNRVQHQINGVTRDGCHFRSYWHAGDLACRL